MNLTKIRTPTVYQVSRGDITQNNTDAYEFVTSQFHRPVTLWAL